MLFRSLSALDAGEYGECERCGEEIGAARLKALPTATLCIECAKEMERKNKTRAPGDTEVIQPAVQLDVQEEEA